MGISHMHCTFGIDDTKIIIDFQMYHQIKVILGFDYPHNLISMEENS